MRKLVLCIVCLAAMMMAGTGLKAQEVTIVLNPGWTWISYPGTDTVDIATAFGSFTPEVGDIFKSKWGMTTYLGNGQWRGSLSPVFYPGYGYHYKSNRQMPVVLTFNAQQPAPQLVVTTSEPTNVTSNSATCGGNVASSNGDYVSVTLKGICWSTNPNPTFNDNYIEAGNGLGSFTALMTELTPNTTYYVRAFAVTPTGTFYGEEVIFFVDYEYVDLGLPSGTLWATCNVGANAPEECGDYFAWGETQPKDYYDWSTYQYCMGSQNTLTKYCNKSSCGYNGYTDNLTTLEPSDDAATVNWGVDWRMPTKAEWQELYNNTTCTWTTQSGVSGCLFTASNGNNLFIPFAGYRQGSSLYYDGSHGYYCSTSLWQNSPDYAIFFYFYSGHYSTLATGRSYGRSVRAVRSTPQNTSFIIDITVNPAEGGEVSGGGNYQQGAECTLIATANDGYIFTNWTENSEVVSTETAYSFTVNGNRNLVANFIVSNIGNHGYVDLGLPSGILWATCNVGAVSPEGYGDYFAWAETQPKNYYGWNNYQYCMGSSSTLTKYCCISIYGYNEFFDNLITLLPEDDAATANWGNGWRMPTKTEWQELLDNTTVTWTTQNGVNGRLFTASNGNTLFLPAAGYRSESSLNDAGNYGRYWSSSLFTGPAVVPYNAWNIHFYSDNCTMNGYSRRYGLSVRAVHSSGQN